MKVSLRLLLAVAVFTLALVSAEPRSTEAQTPSPFCQVGSSTYNAVLCAQYGGSTNPYCNVYSGVYNATLCAQYGATTSTSIYCQVGTVNYNAALCAAYGGSSANIYCQPGTATYNATLCAQYGGSSVNPYCQAGTATYNPGLCAQLTGNQPGHLVVSTTASGLDCGARATITVSVQSVTGSQVPDGTSVTLSASMGTVSPQQGTTTNGNLQASYVAPLTGSGQVTITATAGTATGSTIMALNCAPPTPRPTTVVAVAPVATPVPAAVTAPAAQPATTTITPPRTGDGGLAGAQP
jgi:hypothetical protein